MPIYELTPQNLSEPDWEASVYQGRAVVRARDESMARMKANTAFGIAVEVKSRFQQIVTMPWTNGSLVSCQELTEPKYPSDGPEGVLYPEDCDEY